MVIYNKNCKPVSRILSHTKVLPLSFIWDKHRCLPLSAYPPSSGEQPSNTGIFGISARKVYPTNLLPKKPVVSYTAFSPFLRLRRSGYFLWHSLVLHQRRKSRLLAGALLCAVRTFLPPPRRKTIAQLAATRIYKEALTSILIKY